jgi:acyl-coenzyme A thioesterase PaaI-like protein
MSSTRQGLLRDIKLPPGVFRRGINLWPPFLGAGVRVTRVADDYREIDVTLKLGLLNRNYFGTQFGGSMFAMTDPFFALMMLHNLGSDYVVWDRAGAIRYLKPGRGNVFAHFRLAEEAIARARAATTRGRKHEPTFTVAIVDGDGATIAEVDKTLYVRRRPAPGSSAAKAAARPATKSAAPPAAKTAAGSASKARAKSRQGRPASRRAAQA